MNKIIDEIRNSLEQKSSVRDLALQRSRKIIRNCAETIRAVHRNEQENAFEKLEGAKSAAKEMVADLKDYPDLYFAGYTQDALKEVVEAVTFFDFVFKDSFDFDFDGLNIEPHTFLNGLCEAASELRRLTLDYMRKGEMESAEKSLVLMEEVYTYLTTIDFPDAITGGLRRSTDILRSVLERTRGDVTMAMRQEKMRQALADFEKRMAQ